MLLHPNEPAGRDPPRIQLIPHKAQPVPEKIDAHFGQINVHGLLVVFVPFLRCDLGILSALSGVDLVIWKQHQLRERRSLAQFPVDPLRAALLVRQWHELLRGATLAGLRLHLRASLRADRIVKHELLADIGVQIALPPDHGGRIADPPPDGRLAGCCLIRAFAVCFGAGFGSFAVYFGVGFSSFAVYFGTRFVKISLICERDNISEQ